MDVASISVETIEYGKLLRIVTRHPREETIEIDRITFCGCPFPKLEYLNTSSGICLLASRMTGTEYGERRTKNSRHCDAQSDSAPHCPHVSQTHLLSFISTIRVFLHQSDIGGAENENLLRCIT